MTPALIPWEAEPRFELLPYTYHRVKLPDRTRATSRFGGRYLSLRVHDLELVEYASNASNWRGGVYATVKDHQARVLPILQAAEGVILFFVWLIGAPGSNG